MNKIKTLIEKYREQLSYLFFGVLTTAVNYIVFWCVNALFNDRLVLLTNLIAFAAATAFAYITNKLFVFESKSWKMSVIVGEALSFVGARIFSFCIEEAGLFVSDSVLHLGEYHFGIINGVMIAKILLSVIVVVLNYFFSKFFVFSKKKSEEQK